MHRFMDLSDLSLADRATPAEQEQWFRENGPDAPELLDHLRRHGADYDRVLFWSYRYSDTYFGLPLVADRAVLVPTAEEDPLIHVDVLAPFFALPRGVPVPHAGRGDAGRRSRAGGQAVRDHRLRARSGVGRRRIRASRRAGARRSVRAVSGAHRSEQRLRGADSPLPALRRDSAADVQLVMAGPASMPIPEHPPIRALGFVDDARARGAADAGARALMMPSPFESLSMVLLEAWNHGLPALVNARCKVLRGQVERADGGLYYGNAVEFIAALDYLLDHPDAARQLGPAGARLRRARIPLADGDGQNRGAAARRLDRIVLDANSDADGVSRCGVVRRPAAARRRCPSSRSSTTSC